MRCSDAGRKSLQNQDLLLHQVHPGSNLLESFQRLCGMSGFNVVEMMYGVGSHCTGNELCQKHGLQCGYFELNNTSQSVPYIISGRPCTYVFVSD